MVRNNRPQTALVAFAILAAIGVPGPSNQRIGAIAATPMATPDACPITQPNNVPYPEFGEVQPPNARDLEPGGGYGNASLWTNLWMWGEGEDPVPSSHVMANGAFGAMKWAWYRYLPGPLTNEGRRLDTSVPPLRADVSEGYGSSGLQVARIVFLTTGCWEISVPVGDASLVFLTLVKPPPKTTKRPARHRRVDGWVMKRAQNPGRIASQSRRVRSRPGQ